MTQLCFTFIGPNGSYSLWLNMHAFGSIRISWPPLFWIKFIFYVKNSYAQEKRKMKKKKTICKSFITCMFIQLLNHNQVHFYHSMFMFSHLNCCKKSKKKNNSKICAHNNNNNNLTRFVGANKCSRKFYIIRSISLVGLLLKHIYLFQISAAIVTANSVNDLYSNRLMLVLHRCQLCVNCRYWFVCSFVCVCVCFVWKSIANG